MEKSMSTWSKQIKTKNRSKIEFWKVLFLAFKFQLFSSMGSQWAPKGLQEAFRIEFGSIWGGFGVDFGRVLGRFRPILEWMWGKLGETLDEYDRIGSSCDIISKWDPRADSRSVTMRGGPLGTRPRVKQKPTSV